MVTGTPWGGRYYNNPGIDDMARLVIIEAEVGE